MSWGYSSNLSETDIAGLLTQADLRRSAGLKAYRIPLSGAVGGFKNDVELRIGNKVFTLESKVRGKGFGWFYKALIGSDALGHQS